MDETTTTAAPSQVPSMLHPEKASATPSLKSKASVDLDTEIEAKEKQTPLEEAEALERPAEEPEAEHASGLKLATLMVALCLAVFLVALDNTIIATAICYEPGSLKLCYFHYQDEKLLLPRKSHTLLLKSNIMSDFSAQDTGIDLEKLKGQDNYIRWSRDFRLIADVKGVWKIITGEEEILTKPELEEYLPVKTKRVHILLINTIPRITDNFHALNDVGWYASSYLLTTCAFQLLFGKFYTFFSIKWVFLTAIAVFELGSLICGVAPSSIALIVGRAIAGVGSAGIFSGGLIIIAYSVPLAKRPIYTGLVGAMYGVASVAGPLMGGAFTDHLTWRWCFYINLPIGAVTFILITLFFKSPKREKEAAIGFLARLQQFDIPGTIVFIPAVVCLLLALQWGGTTYPWSNGRIIALFILFGVLIIAFIGIQVWKGDNATVPPRIMVRSVVAGSWFGICLGGAFFTLVYYLPIWFQAIQGVSATESGIRNLPLILAQVLASVLTGGLTTVLGYYTQFLYVATILMAIGAGLLTTLTVTSGAGMWIGYQILFGLGSGAGFQQPLIAAQTVLPLEDVAIGTSVVMFLQILGGALFVSVAQNIFGNALVTNLVANVPSLNPAAVTQSGATNLLSVVGQDSIDKVLVAYNAALTKTFQIPLVLACLSLFGAILMEWRSVKGKKLDTVAV